jgi:hypothetical protein
MDEKTNGRLEGKWLGLTLDATDAEARAAFRQRFGYEAQRVHRASVIMYVGPIRQDAPGAFLSDATP